MLPKRIQAGAFGDLTLATLVGVSIYKDPDIRPLPACAPETARLYEGLKNPSGCRLKDENVDVLINEGATRQAVIASLERRALTAGPEQILIFYFAGHGEPLDSGFGLLMHDSKSSDFASTTLTSEDLDTIFAPCAARGVLIILDCCGGAALAENAPSFLQQVGRHDFRILLSASRANQSSWETAEGSLFTRHLLAVVDGREQVSAAPGEVYFNDLLRHLRDSVSEEITNAKGRLPAQEPVFNGGYTEDPLVFLHTGETLKQIRVRIQRYSQKYVLSRIKWTAATILGVLSLGLGLFWVVLDQSYYLDADDKSISIFHGHPSLTGLGYPRLVWTSEVPRNHLKENSALRLGEKVRFGRDEALFTVVERELSPAGRSLWLLWSRQNNLARSVAQEGLKQTARDRPNDWSELAQLFAESSEQSDLPRLEEFAKDRTPEVAQAAVRALNRLARTRALQALSSRGFSMSQVGIHLEALQLWSSPCDDALLTYLNAFAAAPYYSQFVRATIDTALRSKCSIDTEPLLGVDTAHQPVVALLLTLQAGESATELAAALAAEIRDIVRQFVAGQPGKLADRPGTLSRMIELALALPERQCPLPVDDAASTLDYFRRFLGALDSAAGATAFRNIRTRLAALVTAGCSDINVVLIPPERTSVGGDSQWTIGLRGQRSELVVVTRFAIQESRASADIFQLAELITATDQVASLRTLALAEIDGYWKARLIRRLRTLKAQPTGIEPFLARGDVAVQTEAYLWLATSDRNAALLAALRRLNDPAASFVPGLLTVLVASPEDSRRIVDAVQGAGSDENRRVALITLFGTRDQVVELMSSPRTGTRAAAVDYIAFRDDLPEIAVLVLPRLILPTFFAANLSGMVAHRDGVRREVAATPDWALPVRLKMMLDLRNDLSLGMRLWIEREGRRRLRDTPS